MIKLEGVLLFALDVVKGPYVHCSAPYNPFAKHDANRNSIVTHGWLRKQSLGNDRLKQWTADQMTRLDHALTTWMQTDEEEDCRVGTGKKTTEQGVQNAYPKVFFKSLGTHMGRTNRPSTETTNDCTIGRLIDLFVPRSEFCHRVLWLHLAESGIFYLYWPEEIAGEHYQRKTLRYSLCFMFRVDPCWMTLGKSHIRQFVKPYSMMLRNVAEKLRYAEVKYGYISHGLTETKVPCSQRYTRVRTVPASPSPTASCNPSLHPANQNENCGWSDSQRRNVILFRSTKSASPGFSFTETNAQQIDLTREQTPRLPLLFRQSSVLRRSSTPPRGSQEEVAAYAPERGASLCLEDKLSVPLAMMGAISNHRKLPEGADDVDEEGGEGNTDEANVQGEIKDSAEEDETTSRTTPVMHMDLHKSHEHLVQNFSSSPVVPSSPHLNLSKEMQSELVRQPSCPPEASSSFVFFLPKSPSVAVAPTPYPVLSSFVIPLGEHRWVPLADFIKSLYRVLREADPGEIVIDCSPFETTLVLDWSDPNQNAAAHLKMQCAWDQTNSEHFSLGSSITKDLTCMTTKTFRKTEHDVDKPQIQDWEGKAKETKRQKVSIGHKVYRGDASATSVKRVAKQIERRAAVLAGRLRKEKISDPKSVYLSNSLVIRISRIEPLRAVEPIRLHHVPIPIISYCSEKMEDLKRMDIIGYEILKLVDGRRTVAAIAFMLSLKMSATLKEFYSKAMYHAVGLVAKASSSTNNKNYGSQKGQVRKKSGTVGSASTSSLVGNGLEAWLAESSYSTRGLRQHSSPYVPVSVFHYASSTESRAAIASRSDSPPIKHLNQAKRNITHVCESFQRRHDPLSTSKDAHSMDVFLHALQRGVDEASILNAFSPPFLAPERATLVEIPVCWNYIFDALAEALLHLQMYNFIRLLEVYSRQTSYHVTQSFYEILGDYKHPARKTIGSYMLQVTDEVRFACRQAYRVSSTQKPRVGGQTNTKVNSKERAKNTHTRTEGLSSRSKLYHQQVVGQPEKPSASKLNRQFAWEARKSNVLPCAAQRQAVGKTHSSFSPSTTLTSLLCTKKCQDSATGKAASFAMPGSPLDKDETADPLRRANSIKALVGASGSSHSASYTIYPPSILSTEQPFQQTRVFLKAQDTRFAEHYPLTPATTLTVPTDRENQLSSWERREFLSGVTVVPGPIPASTPLQFAYRQIQRPTDINSSLSSHLLFRARFNDSLCMAIGLDPRSNRWYLTFLPIPQDSDVTSRLSVPASFSISPGFEEGVLSGTVKGSLPASWGSQEGKFPESIGIKSVKPGSLGFGMKEPTVGDVTVTSNSSSLSSVSSQMFSHLSSLSSSTMTSLQVPDIALATNNDVANSTYTRPMLFGSHQKDSHDLETLKLFSPIFPESGGQTAIHTETEVNLATSAALCALGKFQRNTIEVVQQEMQRLPAWAGAFGRWSMPCCRALVELAMLNGWLEKVTV